jgi:hypothetical protein
LSSRVLFATKENPLMIFSVRKSTDPDLVFAPYEILIDGEVFLNGLELEEEADDICRLLVDLPPLREAKPILSKHRPNVVPINTRLRWLAGGKGGRRLAPKQLLP